MGKLLTIYLRNHEAGGQGGYDLFRRAASAQRQRPWAAELEALRDEVKEDLDSLRQVLRTAGTTPDPLLGPAMRLGERIGRLKPNGQLLSRSPLSDLVEVEGLLNAVRAKAAGWQALIAADGPSWSPVNLQQLLERADQQAERLITVHRLVAGRVLDRP